MTTGRALPMAMLTVKKVGLEDDYVITTSGGVISKNNEIIIENVISQESLDIVNKFIIENNLYAQYLQGSHYYVDNYNENTYYYETMTKILPITVGKEVYQLKDIKRILVTSNDKEMFDKIIDFLKGTKGIKFFFFWNNWIQIDSDLSSKGNAILKLCEILNVDPSKTMGIGDEINDIPMWEVVGYPVVMGQAKDEFKQGRIVTDTCANGGVAKVLKKYCIDEDF